MYKEPENITKDKQTFARAEEFCWKQVHWKAAGFRRIRFSAGYFDCYC